MVSIRRNQGICLSAIVNGHSSQLAEPLSPTSTATPETFVEIIPSPTFAEYPPSLACFHVNEGDAIRGNISVRGDNPYSCAYSLLNSYRVEELELPKSIAVRIDETKIPISVTSDNSGWAVQGRSTKLGYLARRRATRRGDNQQGWF